MTHTANTDVEFEAHARDRGYDVKRGPNGGYLYRDAAVAHRAWKAARRAPVEVPQGFALVPIEATPVMRKAAADGWLDCGSRMILDKAAAAYRAGVAAYKATKGAA